MKHKKTYVFWIIFLIFVLLNIISKNQLVLVDLWYSQRFYPMIGTIIGQISGLFSFSLFGVLIILFLILSILSLYQCLRKRITFKWSFILKSLASIYILFILLWGLNYHRMSILDHMNIEHKDISQTDITLLLDDLIPTANDIRENLNEDVHGVFKLSLSNQELIQIAELGYQEIKETIPILEKSYGPVKPVLFSSIMLYTGVEGIYMPFTFEPHFNTHAPDLFKPFTILHELAHQKGFAREDEANFIAYLAGIHHPNDEFKYASLVSIINYLLHAIKINDEDLYQDYKTLLSEKIMIDLLDYQQFWNELKSPISMISSFINDAYLRFNLQSEGIQSYQGVVKLVVNYHKSI